MTAEFWWGVLAGAATMAALGLAAGTFLAGWLLLKAGLRS